MTLEQYLKKARIEKGMNQADVSAKLGFTSPQYISNCERGLCPISEKLFKKLSKIYDIPLITIIDLRVNDERQRLIKMMGVK